MVLPVAALVLSLGLVAPAQDARHRGSPLRDGEVVAKGKYFAIHMHYDDRAAAENVLPLVEAAWPLTMELLGTTDAPAPDWPMAVHVYPDKDAFAEVEAWLTRGYFRDTESFSHWDSRTAHVALAPPLSSAARSDVLVSNQTREVLLHEAAHLSLYSVVPTYRWHPTWFAEGFAMTVELELSRRFGLVADPSEHPRFSTNQLRAKRLWESGRLPSIAAILDESLASLTFDEKYALWLEFFRVLRAPGKERSFRRLINEMRSLGGGPGMRGKVTEFMRREYGEAELTRALNEHLASLASEWDEQARSLETMGPEWLQCAFPMIDACVWRTKRVAQPTYAIEGRFVLLGSSIEHGWPEMRVLLGRSQDEHVAVRFRAGRIMVTRFDALEREPLVELDAPWLTRGEEYAFRIDVSKRVIDVAVDGVPRLNATVPRADAPRADLEGAWGLGAMRGTSGFWRGVRLLR